jgi:hypothetical protein
MGIEGRGCQVKCRLYDGTRWVKTNKVCGRDGLPIYQEVGYDGVAYPHFSCERSGCTWPDYNMDGVSDLQVYYAIRSRVLGE